MNYTSARQRRVFWRKNRRKILLTIYALILYFIFIFMIVHIRNNHQSYISPLPSDIAGQSAQIKSVQTKITPTPTKTLLGSTPVDARQMMVSLPNGLLVWQTYVHESGAGKHDSCKPDGYNGFGYGQTTDGSYPCFTSLKEIATKVSNWFTLQLKTMTVKQALCYYNHGKPNGKLLDDCDYAEYTLAL